ncbi:sulfate transporter N-terminal domain with GLY motif-domain-containing protein [Pavlovales sp. CCMP2436]|nr:sulfate transporter N-terminal domain with GLY motif-domain-containing protein [Pavlovales sp. CCMP2436]
MGQVRVVMDEVRAVYDVASHLASHGRLSAPPRLTGDEQEACHSWAKDAQAMRNRQVAEQTEGRLRLAHGGGENVSPLFDPESEADKPLYVRVLKGALRKFRILLWIRTYSRVDLAADVRAGLTVSVVLIPQAIAYALLVEVDPVIGLYASFIPLIVFTLFTTSNHVSVGPFALISLVVASVANGIASPDRTDAEYLQIVLTLSVLSGLLQLAMGLLGLGIIASFLADPCVAGFTTAVALIIMSSQLKYLLGRPIGKGSMPETADRRG